MTEGVESAMRKTELLTLSAASREPGAPTRAVLSGMANRGRPPSFIVRIDGKPLVDTASDAWLEYLEGRAPEPASLTEEKRRAQQLKNEILEIDLLRKKREVVDVKTMDYLFTFIGRAFNDGVSTIKVAMPEVKRLLKVDKDRDAERLLLANLQRTFGNVMDDLNRHIAEELGEPV
jgi:hypothetical protein